MKGSVKLPVFIDDARKYVNTTQLRAKYLGASYEAEYCQWQTLHDLGSLMETASLIITPNAYLEGKLIASYPPDPSGDLSVTRATTATRVNSAGLVELVPYNLLGYSQDFSNAYWSTYQATIGSNVITAPDGTMTADSITNNLSAVASVYKTGNQNFGTNTISCYFKKGTYNYVFLELGGNAYNFCSFNLATGTTEVISGFSNVTIQSVGNGWYRCSATASDTAATITVGYGTAGSPTAGDVTYLWGAQLVEGSTAKDYQKTETRLNIPRLDYSNGTCPSLLVEPQRTNSCLYSNKISDSTWLKFFDNGGSNPVITDNYGISPDGNQNAQRIQLVRTSTANSYSYILQNITGIAGQSYTWSVWLKSLSGTPSVALSNIGGSYANIVTLSNEWERYEFTTTATGTGLQAMFLLFEALPSTSLTADFLAYGFQLEAGNYASSYIPTTSASVTRNADVISKTGISSLIGQTEGTFFVDVNLDETSDYNGWFLKENATFDTFVFLQRESNGVIAAGYYGSGALQARIETAPSQPSGHYKIAFGYKNNDFVMYVNGTQIGTDTSGSVSGLMDYIDLHWTQTGTNHQNAVALWKTRLTNTQLAQLTTI